MTVKTKMKNVAAKKKAKQEMRIRELCREYKARNAEASDKATLIYAFSYVYGKKAPQIVQKLMKDKEAYNKIKNDIDQVNEIFKEQTEETNEKAEE